MLSNDIIIFSLAVGFQEGYYMKKGKHLFCNVCGRELKIERGIVREDVFEATKEWGYFSDKDLEIHQFDMCEQCYNKMIESFAIPVSIKKNKEVL